MKNSFSTYSKVGLNILGNKLGFSPLISFVTFLVTLRCNHKCVMCDAWKNQSEHQMSLEDIENIFRQLKRVDVVRLSGGEPFLHKNLAEIITIVQKNTRPSIIHITTNGFLTEAIGNTLQRINNLANIHIKVSIDAVGDNNDQIRGVAGAWKRALDTLISLAEFRKKGLFVAVNQTIARRCSIEDRDELKRICNGLHLPLLTQIAFDDSVLYKSERNISSLPKKRGAFSSFYDFEEEELKFILQRLFAEISLIPKISERMVKKYYLRGLWNRLLYRRGEPNPACCALRNHLRIMPDGQVPICLYDSTIVGDLTKQNIPELFASAKLRHSREKVKSCKGCWAECEVIPNGVYSGDFLRALLY